MAEATRVDEASKAVAGRTGEPLRVGSMALNMPPFSLGVDAGLAAEQAGADWVVYWDQLCSTHPRSIMTPDITTPAAAAADFDAYFDCAPLIAAAAAKTERIDYAYGVIDAVRRHPSLIAQTLNTLDHATKGHVWAVMANGENKQMKPYGIPRKGANDKLLDALPIVKLLLSADEPVSYEGKVWKLDRAVMTLPPYDDRPPPVLVAGGGPDVLQLIGEHGDGWVTYIPGGLEDDAREYAENVETIKKTAAAARRDPDELRMVQLLICVMHEDEEVVRQLRDHPVVRWNSMLVTPTSATFRKWGMEHPYGDDWVFSRDCIPPWVSRSEALDVADRTPVESVDRTHFVGTPEQVLNRAKPFIAGGATDLVVLNYTDLCGAEYMEGANRAGAELAAALREL
jgi:phthiodiolone/phenolphthiodiolone dimycocerosates ketoreductase